MGKKILKKTNKWIYILASILLLAYSIPNPYIKVILFASVFYSAWIFNLCNTTLLMLITSMLLDTNISTIILIIATFPAYAGPSLKSIKLYRNKILYSIVFLLALLISVLLGEDPNIRTMILYILCWVAYLSASNDNYSEEDIKSYAIAGILIVFVVIVIAAINGNIKLMYGRLSINDNIRELANAVSVPLYLLFISLIKCIEQKKKKNITLYAGILFGTYILLATLSRGAIFAIAMGIIVMFFMARVSTHKKIIYAGILICVAIVIIGYLSTNDFLRMERLFNSSDGLNGREEIWLSYWNEMNRDTTTLFFGFGPGDVRRLNVQTSYTHSLILDILFSYGFVGFSLAGVLVSEIVIKALKAKNATALGTVTFAVLTYATHGVSTAVAFYIMLGLAKQMIEKHKKREN